MNSTLQEPAGYPLVNAIEANQSAHAALYSQLPGTLLWDDPELFGLLTNLDPSESLIYRTHFPSAGVDARIERVVQRFHEHGCLLLHWQLSPSTMPKYLGQDLEAHGFIFLVRAPGMTVWLDDPDDQPVADPRFIIQEVSKDDQLRSWTHILASADGLSNAFEQGLYTLFRNPVIDQGGINRLFLGLVDREPVATSRLFGIAGVAGIWQVATLPGARGHGYGKRLTLAAAKAGLALGYHFAVLLASPVGVGLYRRLGFQEICKIDVYRFGG